jgi:hypothetical protein
MQPLGLAGLAQVVKVFGDIGNENCCFFNSKLSNIHVGKLPKNHLKLGIQYTQRSVDWLALRLSLRPQIRKVKAQRMKRHAKD